MSSYYEENRDLHCVHPNQKWCDCDWCRFCRDKDRAPVRIRCAACGLSKVTAPGFAVVVCCGNRPEEPKCRHCGFIGRGHVHSLAPRVESLIVSSLKQARRTSPSQCRQCATQTSGECPNHQQIRAERESA